MENRGAFRHKQPVGRTQEAPWPTSIKAANQLVAVFSARLELAPWLEPLRSGFLPSTLLPLAPQNPRALVLLPVNTSFRPDWRIWEPRRSVRAHAKLSKLPCVRGTT